MKDAVADCRASAAVCTLTVGTRRNSMVAEVASADFHMADTAYSEDHHIQAPL